MVDQFKANTNFSLEILVFTDIQVKKILLRNTQLQCLSSFIIKCLIHPYLLGLLREALQQRLTLIGEKNRSISLFFLSLVELFVLCNGSPSHPLVMSYAKKRRQMVD
jgi:hypothetical protein